jgi:hypothetical protein
VKEPEKGSTKDIPQNPPHCTHRHACETIAYEPNLKGNIFLSEMDQKRWWWEKTPNERELLAVGGPN